jgi:hypothetical protein
MHWGGQTRRNLLHDQKRKLYCNQILFLKQERSCCASSVNNCHKRWFQIKKIYENLEAFEIPFLLLVTRVADTMDLH